MNKEILKLAIPNILTNISIPLLTSVDTALMGHQEEATAFLAALGLGGAIFNLVYWNFSFLRMGTTGLVAQAFGQNNKLEAFEILVRGVIQAIVFAFFLLLLQGPLLEAGMWIANTPEDSKSLVAAYFNTRIWAAPATLLLYVLMGWFFGAQNSIYPLILTLFLNVLNIVANYVFVYYYNMDLKGVALGTVLSQYLTAIIGLLLWYFKYRTMAKGYEIQFLKKKGVWLSLWKLNQNIIVRSACLLFVFTFFYNQSASLGLKWLAINQVLLQMFYWMSYAVDGFGFAAESIVGKYYGAKNNKALKKAIHLSFIWGMAFSLLIVLFYWLSGDWILSLFTSDLAIIKDIKPFWIWLIIFPIISAPPFIWDGVFVGVMDSKVLRNSMLVAALAFVGTWYFSQDYGNHGLWFAMSIFMISRMLVQQVAYFKMAKTL